MHYTYIHICTTVRIVGSPQMEKANKEYKKHHHNFRFDSRGISNQSLALSQVSFFFFFSQIICDSWHLGCKLGISKTCFALPFHYRFVKYLFLNCVSYSLAFTFTHGNFV